MIWSMLWLRRRSLFLKGEEVLLELCMNIGRLINRLCPIFQISNVSGERLDLLRAFLNLLPAYKAYDSQRPAEFQITDTFSVPGVGTVGQFSFCCFGIQCM